MTRRQLRRHTRRHPVAVILAGGLVLFVADAMLHVLGLVVVATVIVGAAYLAGQRTRPAARVTPTRTTPAAAAQLVALGAERDQFAARVADLGRQLADARASAAAAWDAAAEHPPTSRAEPSDTGGKRAALLADPLGGARPLIPS